MARSYIKLYGPPIMKGIRALEKVAVEMSRETTVRFYDVFVPTVTPDMMASGEYREAWAGYVAGIPVDVSMPMAIEERVKLISSAADTLGEYDFFFEWGEEPTKDQVLGLIEKIDEALAECGCNYTVVTK